MRGEFAPYSWQKTIESLEDCMKRLVDTTIQQSVMNQQMIASAQVPKVDVPTLPKIGGKYGAK